MAHEIISPADAKAQELKRKRELLKARRDAYRAANAEKEKARQAAWYANNPEKVKAHSKAYYAANSEREKARRAEYRANNPEKVKASLVAWRVKNRKKENATTAAYRANNREKLRAAAAEWRVNNPEENKARQARYRVNNPEKVNAKNRNRHACKKMAEGHHAAEDIQRIHQAQNGKCAYCKVKLGKKYHVDHIVPLAKGGSNWPANLQITCASCNSSKCDRDPIEHARRLGMLL